MSDNLVSFPKTLKKIDRIRKKTDFRFDPLPSLIAEEWLPILSHAELKCVLYICRRTWGWRKEWDSISIDQFMHGIKAKNGKQSDYGTGLKRTAMRSAIKSLEAKGLIEINRRSTKTNFFRLTVCSVSLASDIASPIKHHPLGHKLAT